MFGSFFFAKPDFEFENFTLEELVCVVRVAPQNLIPVPDCNYDPVVAW